MPLTKKELEERRKGIGASDVAAILGEDSYRTAHDVYAEKVYGVEQSSSEAADLGNYLESGAINFGAQKIGLEPITTNLMRTVPNTPIRANLDAYVIEDGQEIPLEAKAVGILNPMGVDIEWGDEWSSDIPSQYVLQLTTQMMAVGAPYGYLSAVIGGRGHRIYRLPYDEDIARIILGACADFWQLVQFKTPPDDWAPGLDTLTRMERQSGVIISGGEDMARKVIKWKWANLLEKRAKETAATAKAEVIAMLGDAEGADLGIIDGDIARGLAKALDTEPEKACLKTALKYFPQIRNGIDLDKLKKEYPEAYKACGKESTIRVLRLSKPPKGFG